MRVTGDCKAITIDLTFTKLERKLMRMIEKPILITMEETINLMKNSLDEAFPRADFLLEFIGSRVDAILTVEWLAGPTYEEFYDIAGRFSSDPSEKTNLRSDGKAVRFENTWTLGCRFYSTEFLQSVVDDEFSIGNHADSLQKLQKPIVEFDIERNTAKIPYEYIQMGIIIDDAWEPVLDYLEDQATEKSEKLYPCQSKTAYRVKTVVRPKHLNSPFHMN
jgi:hypothetical protein